jgi:hypothetical protein
MRNMSRAEPVRRQPLGVRSHLLLSGAGRTESASIERLIGGVEQEFEKVRAVEGGGSLVPLHYAMRALKIRLRAKDPSERVLAAPDLDGLLGRIEQVITDFGLDPGRQVRHNMDELRTLLVRVPATTVVS